MLPHPGSRCRFGAHVTVERRDERTGRRQVVHTSLKRLPPCAACGGLMAGDVEVIGARSAMVHAACARRMEVRRG